MKDVKKSLASLERAKWMLALIPHGDPDEISRVIEGLEEVYMEIKPHILTLDEVKANHYRPMYIMGYEREYEGWCVARPFHPKDGVTILDTDGLTTTFPESTYGAEWVCWSDEPTEEQLEGFWQE